MLVRQLHSAVLEVSACLGEDTGRTQEEEAGQRGAKGEGEEREEREERKEKRI